jgi:hypothetical protein
MFNLFTVYEGFRGSGFKGLEVKITLNPEP